MFERSDIADMYSLSPMQEGMLFHYIMDKETTAYFEQFSYRITGELDPRLIEGAFNQLIERHDILRTVFVYKSSAKPRQVVLKRRNARVYFEDISHLEGKEKLNHINVFKEKDREKGFNLSTDILIRYSILKIADRSYEVVLSFHHIIMDGWCTVLLLKEMLLILDHLKRGTTAHLPTPVRYSTYIRWLEKQDKEEGLEYWRKYLDSYENRAAVPNLKKGKEDMDIYRQEQHRFTMDKALTEELNDFSHKNGVTLSTVFHTLWGVLLQKYNNTNDVVFGSVVSGRPAELPGIETMVGLFINTIPLRMKCEPGESFENLLKKVHEQMIRSKSYEYVPLAEIQSTNQLKNELINHIVIFENYPVEKEVKNTAQQNTAGFSITNVEIFEQTNYDLNVFVSPGREASVKIQYNSTIYDSSVIKGIEEHLLQITRQAISNRGIEPGEIDIISTSEKKRLLYDFNDTKTGYPSAKTIHRLFADQVEKTPDHIALVFENKKLTYKELNEQSDRLARHLRSKGVKPGTIVGIFVERSLELMPAVFAVLKAGGTYLPLDPNHPWKRIKYMLKASSTKIVATNTTDSAAAEDEFIFVDLNNIAAHGNANIPGSEPLTFAGDAAYVIYTSGTTGVPKGVVIEHRSVVNFIKGMTDIIDFRGADTILSLTTLSFDIFGLETIVPLTRGSAVAMGSRKEQMDPAAAASVIERETVTILQVTPSRLQLFLSHPGGEVSKSFILLRYLLVGGEAFPEKLLEQVRPLVGGKIYNLYGPTETTIWSTAKDVSGEEPLNLGKPIANTWIYILSKSGLLLPAGLVGELCIAGDGLARGYLNQPELTAERFLVDFYRTYKSYTSYLYKTGDLACWLPDGNIEFLGRSDHQIKLRGFRIELGEIEKQLLKIKEIKEAVVVIHENETGDDDRYLCAYYISRQEITPEILRNRLANRLPDYMIPSFFLSLEKMPLTPSGKIDRKNLPHPDKSRYRAGFKDTYTAPRNEKERLIAAIWSEILGVEKIGIHHNFLQLGGHSLKAVAIISRVNKELGARLPVSIILKKPTIAGLVESIAKEKERKPLQLEKCPAGEHYELSYAQKRLWFFQQMEPGNPAYNISQVVRFTGALDIPALERSLQMLVQRHESLRTSIMTVEELPVQVVHEHAAFDIRRENISHLEKEEKQKKLYRLIREEGVKPFDLAQPPLFRAALIQLHNLEPQEHVMIFVMHHIISDGRSIEIMIREFTSIYDKPGQHSIIEKNLKPLTFQYKDFAYWQNRLIAGNGLKDQHEYWHQKLAGELPVLDLPTDYPRPGLQSSKGDKVSFDIGAPLTGKLKNLSRQESSTLFMILTAAFKVLLYRYTNQEDLLIGTLISGRSSHEVENIIGYFVNILVLRDIVKGKWTFEDFLRNVRGTMLEAYDNQDYPFDKLVDELKVQRNPGRSPVFDILLVYQDFGALELESPLSSLEFDFLERDYVVSKYDLYVDIFQMPDHIKINIEFCTDLYKKETIGRMVDHYLNILHSAADSPGQPTAKIDMMPEAEKRRLLIDFNDTAVEIPRNLCYQQLFRKQVAINPGRTAVKHNRETSTYNQLNEQANRIARYLLAQGVKPGMMVALYMKRSISMLASIIGVFKAGAAYLPIEVEYPNERTRFMLQDAEVTTAITDRESRQKLEEITRDAAGVRQVLCVDDGDKLEEYKADDPGGTNTPDDYAYMIYTSGTTGQPKGALIHQLGMINHLYAKINDLALNENDRIAHTASPCFDISVWQFLAAPLTGGMTVIFDYQTVLNPEALLKGLRQEEITVFESVPSLLTVFLEMIENSENSELPHLGWLIPTGESLPPPLVEKWFTFYPQVKVVNAYGPTEASDDITHYVMSSAPGPGQLSVPIGKPVQNMRIYILDKNLSLCPVGVRGEICTAGLGVGKGYWKTPEKTARAFIPNPHAFGSADQDYTLLYKTGDTGYFRSDGNIECLGRIDNQVKIRGFRIELEEIETVMRKHPSLADCAVVVKKNGGKGDSLAAFLKEKEKIDSEEFKQFLLEYLPPHMIPAAFIKLDELPLSMSGKVDRRALAAMDIDIGAADAKVKFTAPRSKTEKEIAEIWAGALEMEKDTIGIHHNFFDLGGHSLLIPRISRKLDKRFPGKCEMADLFEYVTIYQLSRHIDGVAGEEKNKIIELSID